jgi:hypothetical protein
MGARHMQLPREVIVCNTDESVSVEMRISGYGLVPARYDPKTELVSYEFTQNLVPKTYTVILSAKVQGSKMERRWNFTVDPSAPALGKQGGCSGGLVVFSQLADDAPELPAFVLLDH